MIAIEKDRITIHSSMENTWLTQHQIADTFEVYQSAVGSNIRSILKAAYCTKTRCAAAKEPQTET